MRVQSPSLKYSEATEEYQGYLQSSTNATDKLRKSDQLLYNKLRNSVHLSSSNNRHSDSNNNIGEEALKSTCMEIISNLNKLRRPQNKKSQSK